MRIGIISNLYPPNERGGAELIARRVADELTKRGHEVDILTSQPYAGLSSLRLSLQEKHVEWVYRFHPLNIFGIENVSQKPFYWKLLWHAIDLVGPGSGMIIRNWMIDGQPEVVLTHNIKGIGLSVARHIQKHGVRHVHTLHDVQLTIPSGLLMWGEEESFLNNSFLRRWYEKFAQWAIGIPDVVISPSVFLMNMHVSRGFFSKSKKQILPNPSPSVLVPNRLPERSGPLRFLFVGQLETHKGILFLIDALKKLTIPFELHIAGEGTLRSEIELVCEEQQNYFFHGFIALDPMLKLIATADVVIVPSLCYENSPTVIYESFAVGTPVIASRIGGIPELIVEGENGYLFEPGNKESFLSVLEHVTNDSEHFWKKAPHIREMAETYSIKKYVNELEKMLKH